MKKINYIIVLLVLIVLTGCAKAPNTNYYVLSSYVDSKDHSSVEAGQQNVSVFIASIPSYLERNQVAMRKGSAVSISYSDFELWAEPLRQGLARVLVEILNQKLMPKAGAIIYRSGQADYRLSIELSRFEGGLNSKAEIESSWQLKYKDELVKAGFFKQEIATGDTVESLIDAQSKLVIVFADSLATEVQSIIK